MAEAHNAVTFRLQHHPGQLTFDTRPVPYRGIVTRAVYSTYLTFRKQYYRIYQIAYPAKVWSLGAWSVGLWAIERYKTPELLHKLRIGVQR